MVALLWRRKIFAYTPTLKLWRRHWCVALEKSRGSKCSRHLPLTVVVHIRIGMYFQQEFCGSSWHCWMARRSFRVDLELTNEMYICSRL